MKQLILLVFVIAPFVVYSQDENDSIHPKNDTLPAYQNWMFKQYVSFGVYPELQFVKGPVLGISASIANVTQGEGIATDIGMNLGFDYAPSQQFYGPKVSLWADVIALIFPANAAVNVMYYFQDDKTGWYCRPEIGIGIPRLHLKYGFGFRLAGDELTGVARHSIALGYHITLGRKMLMK